MLLPAYIISDTKERNKEEFLSVFGLYRGLPCQKRHVDVLEDGNTILKLEGAGCWEDFFPGQVVTGFYMGRKVPWAPKTYMFRGFYGKKPGF